MRGEGQSSKFILTVFTGKCRWASAVEEVPLVCASRVLLTRTSVLTQVGDAGVLSVATATTFEPRRASTVVGLPAILRDSILAQSTVEAGRRCAWICEVRMKTRRYDEERRGE